MKDAKKNIKTSEAENEEKENDLNDTVVKYTTQDLIEAVEEKTSKMQRESKRLQEKIHLLSHLPLKVEARINELVPHASKAILDYHKQAVQELKEDITQCKNEADNLSYSMSKFNHWKDKQFTKTLAIYSIITVLASASATFGMMKYFPSRFIIHADGAKDLITYGNVILKEHTKKIIVDEEKYPKKNRA